MTAWPQTCDRLETADSTRHALGNLELEAFRKPPAKERGGGL